MKALLNEFYEYLNKNNKNYDLKYFKRLLKDDKKVVDLYVSSLNDDIKSVETCEDN